MSQQDSIPMDVADASGPIATAPAAGRARRLALVAALYSTQNLSLGFFTYAFLTIAQARGVALASIGAAAGIAMILTLKFLWAPLVDRFGSRRFGHYRGWLIATQSLLGIGIGSLALFDPADDFGVVLAVFAVLFLLAGTQDIAADAAATRLLRPEERGLGNGFQSAGSSVAQVVGGGLVLVVYGVAGWQAAAIMLAVFSLLPLPLILAWREDSTSFAQPTPHITLRSALAFFARPAVRLWCFVLLPMYTIGFTISYNMIRPILVAGGWDETRIGLVVVIGGSVVGVLAGIAAGAVVTGIGRKHALVWLGLVQVIAAFGVLPIAAGVLDDWLVLLVVALGNAAFAAAFAIVYTISMDLTRPESAGTDFTFFTTVTAILMVIAAGVGLVAADAFGIFAVVIVAGVLAAVGLVVTVLRIDRVLHAVDAAPPEGPSH
ncbi:MAG: MFS transporter [Gulosibacter sp.]|uniref:MFS transporter n=1 Tax=Gulosibacter sp. TaxID=2817531 RepID=UPI003F91E6FE